MRPTCGFFALKSNRGQTGTNYSAAASWPLHVSIAVSAHVRKCCSLEAGGWTPGRGPGWRSSLARPLREGQVESEIRRALGESMWLEAPQCADFCFEKQPRSNGNLLFGSSFLPFTCFHCGLCTCSELLLIGRAKFRISLRLEQKLPVGGPRAEALDGGRALLGPFARVKWRVKSDEPKDW